MIRDQQVPVGSGLLESGEVTIQPPTTIRRHTLDALLHASDRLDGIRKLDLCRGDWVVVGTRNSLYSIFSLGDGLYSVAGGWFDRKGISPTTTTINGCTWGGSAIKTDIVACRGLFLEFGNRVLTTRIQSVRLIRSPENEITH